MSGILRKGSWQSWNHGSQHHLRNIKSPETDSPALYSQSVSSHPLRPSSSACMVGHTFNLHTLEAEAGGSL